MTLVHTVLRRALPSALAVALAACSGEDPDDGLGQGSPPIPGDSAILSTTEPEQLDDRHIIEILAEADTAEIAPSLLAEAHAENAEVIQFAALMVRAHGLLSNELREIAVAEGIVPEPSRDSQLLETQTRAILESLQAHSGPGFDSAYVAAMVTTHEAALNAIDDQLLPAAENELLENAIRLEVRPAVAAHLELIQQIKTTMERP